MTLPTYGQPIRQFEVAESSEGELAIPEGRGKSVTELLISVPGIAGNQSIGTNALGADVDIFSPVYLVSSILIDALICEVTIGGGGGSTGRMAIYDADIDWQPTSLIVQTGAFDINTTGVKTNLVSQTLARGRYLTAINVSDGSTFRRVKADQYLGYDPILGVNPKSNELNNSRAHAAFPSTGVPWDTRQGSTTGMNYQTFLRIVTP